MIKLNTPYTIENGDTVIFTEEKKDTIHGVYKDSALTGTLDGNVLKATFINSKVNAVGLMEITFNETGFDGKWKKGIEPGPMKGKWLGKLSSFKMDDDIESKVEGLNKNAASLTDEQQECMDNVKIQISGVMPNYFFGAVKEKYLTELETALDCASEDLEEIGDVIKALFETTLDNTIENGLELFKSNFDMEILAEKCPNMMEIITQVENNEMNYHDFYYFFFDSPDFGGLDVIEDDAYITITVNGEIVVEEQTLEEFLGEAWEKESVDYDEDAKIAAIAQSFVDAHTETYGIDIGVLDDIKTEMSENGVKQLINWMEPESYKEFKQREHNVTICHDDITEYTYYFKTENFVLAKLIFFAYENMHNFRNSACEYVGSYLFYDNEVLDPDKNWMGNNGIELEYDSRPLPIVKDDSHESSFGKRSLLWMIFGTQYERIS
mgnify:CR=1 FL=1|jgi:hypothetical protein